MHVAQALTDVERIAPCLPGAAVSARNEDGSYNGSFSVKIGPTSAAYNGRLELREVDPELHRATLHAQGSDRRGQGGAEATIVSTLSEAGPGVTRVAVATDYRITGRLAQFGRGGMIEDISEKLLRQFASQLQASLQPADPAITDAGAAATPEPAAPTDAGSGSGSASGAQGAKAVNQLNVLSVLGSVAIKRVRGNLRAYALAALAGAGLVAARCGRRRRRRR